MTTLVIPDIHENYQCAQRLLEGTTWDRCVMLGDYFDAWGATPASGATTAAWLAKVANDTKITCLFGNHDLPYAFGLSRWTQCSGYSKAKAVEITRAKIPWPNLAFFVYIDNWLLSHAGFFRQLLVSPKQMEKTADTLRQALRAGDNHPWLAVSHCRGGNYLCGGPFWQDWAETTPTAGQAQLVGHTPHTAVKEKTHAGDGTKVVDLDTSLRNYALLVDGELTIRKTPELWR